MDCHGKIKVQKKGERTCRRGEEKEEHSTTSSGQFLKPWKLLFGNGKNKKTRMNTCTTKLLATRSTRVIKKTTQLCHIIEDRLLARQLPLSQRKLQVLALLVHCLPSSIGMLSCIKPMLQHHFLSHHKQLQVPKPNNKSNRRKRWHTMELGTIEVYMNQTCQEEQ